MKLFLTLFFATLCAACSTQYKVVETDPKTGNFRTNAVANTITSKIVNLDEYKSILLIPDSDFVKGQLESIGYFDQLITREELETIIIRENLQDEVPSVRDRIGLNQAYEHYKEFLWFRFDTRGKGLDEYGQFILTNPGTLEDIFVAEIKFDKWGPGVNDDTTWYPLFNSLIKYIKANSRTYRK